MEPIFTSTAVSPARQRVTRMIAVLACLGPACVGLTAGTALGQHALGTGHALDNNLRVGSGGINSPWVDPRLVYRYRNAILTGNVPNRSFRGNLGYAAPNDFRDTLGSDDIFRFQRDSYMSGLAVQGVRGIRSVQSAFRMTDPNYQFTRFTVARSAQSVTTADVQRGQGRRLFAPIGAPAAADVLRGAEFIRLSSLAEASEGLRGTVLGYSETQDGGIVELTASPLRGIVPQSIIPPTPAGREDAGETDQSRQDPRISSRLDISRLEVGADPYADLLDRLSRAAEAEQAGREPTDAGLESVADRMTRLMSYEEQFRLLTEVLEKRAAEDDQTEDDGAADDSATGSASGEHGEWIGRPATFDELMDRLLPESARRDLGPISDLAGTAKDLFSEQMRRAQAFLADERYFDAETHFATALRIQPGHPLARIGRLNAQLGAGLFLSAATTLRTLAVTHPEVLAPEYDQSLLPRPERVGHIVDHLREQMDQGGAFAPTAALLLAYLGHVTGDVELVATGLAVTREIGDPDGLADLLERLWLGRPAQEPQSD
ncbi:MAG: hypothetical protein KAS72_12560 [Phycisphaerales bacterium]|nr:hypothetical protein [Phycisphaerales bacterium]